MTPEQFVQDQAVAVRHTFVGLPVSDYTAAYDWYVRVLGRPADMFPHELEAVWRLTPASSLYVVQDGERAGSGLVTLALDDLDAFERRLNADGLTVTEHSAGGSPRRLVLTDADGNRLTFFLDPSQSGE
jgi:catechol 2,3-dioxygenase-like lactoylglutathione lyase family enzyme